MSHAIVQIAYGPRAGHKVVLAPGDVVRVGRSDDADLAVPQDRSLAHVHLEIDWDGQVCQARSRQGATLLGGAPIVQADVPSGAFLRAGDTHLLVHHEDDAPRPLSPAHAEIVGALRAVPHLWGVFDAARSEAVLPLLRTAIDPARSLYEGTQGDALADAAPHLVRFRPDSRLLERLVHAGWGLGWGLYFSFDATEKDVRRHLRRFLVVEEEDTRRHLYFRFYDPRALRRVVPTCSVRQLTALFGDVASFHLEGERGELVTLARADVEALACEDP